MIHLYAKEAAKHHSHRLIGTNYKRKNTTIIPPYTQQTHVHTTLEEGTLIAVCSRIFTYIQKNNIVLLCLHKTFYIVQYSTIAKLSGF